jgi:integrase
METIRRQFTERYVASLPTPEGDREQRYADDGMDGLVVDVQPSGKKSYAFYRNIGGKPRYRVLGPCAELSLEEARHAASEWNSKARAWKLTGWAPEKNPFVRTAIAGVAGLQAPTFSALVERYVEQHIRKETNRPEQAEKRVRWMVRKYFAEWLTRPVDTITVQDVLRLRDAQGKKHHLANRLVELVRAAFNWAAKRPDGRINFWPVENPAKDVVLHDEDERMDIMDGAQLNRLYESLEDEPDQDLRDFIVLALETGARKMNVLAAEWRDVDEDTLTWRIPLSKSGSGYDIGLTGEAVEVFERRRKATLGSKYVFPGLKGGHRSDLFAAWDAFRKRADLPHIHIHDLRRQCGSLAAMGGASLEQIAEMLGQKSVSATGVYARFARQATDQARAAGAQKRRELMAKAHHRQLAATQQKQLVAVNE